MDMFKEITIGEHEYRIARFSARAGSWVARLIGKGYQLTEAEHENILDHCMSLVSRCEAENIFLPIRTGGKFAIAELEHDFETVEKLQDEVFDFNLKDFFVRKLKKTAELARDLNSENSQASTATSSDQ